MTAYILLFAAALWAGIQNTLAGGGTFLTLPALMLTGMNALQANITSTIALFPGQITSAWGGRKLVSGVGPLSFKALVIISGKPDTFIYQWGDRDLEFHHCKTCGCATHTTIAGVADAEKIAVNARLIRGLNPARTKLVQKNNGNDGVFWTKTELPVLPSHDEPRT